MQAPDDVADLIEPPGLASRRNRILMSVHAVFCYVRARTPLHNPLRCQCFARLADAPATIDEPWKVEGEVEEPAIGARRRAKQETRRAVKSYMVAPCLPSDYG
ncbi:MAG: hypothetical protein ACREXY_08915 [Gammaproteobacteria bacterium]